MKVRDIDMSESERVKGLSTDICESGNELLKGRNTERRENRNEGMKSAGSQEETRKHDTRHTTVDMIGAKNLKTEEDGNNGTLMNSGVVVRNTHHSTYASVG